MFGVQRLDLRHLFRSDRRSYILHDDFQGIQIEYAASFRGIALVLLDYSLLFGFQRCCKLVENIVIRVKDFDCDGALWIIGNDRGQCAITTTAAASATALSTLKSAAGATTATALEIAPALTLLPLSLSLLPLSLSLLPLSLSLLPLSLLPLPLSLLLTTAALLESTAAL